MDFVKQLKNNVFLYSLIFAFMACSNSTHEKMIKSSDMSSDSLWKELPNHFNKESITKDKKLTLIEDLERILFKDQLVLYDTLKKLEVDNRLPFYRYLEEGQKINAQISFSRRGGFPKIYPLPTHSICVLSFLDSIEIQPDFYSKFLADLANQKISIEESKMLKPGFHSLIFMDKIILIFSNDCANRILSEQISNYLKSKKLDFDRVFCGGVIKRQ